ncbi:MAG: hypothetical protein AAF191_08790, partial [Verrucomicrobiota bacterium]
MERSFILLCLLPGILFCLTGCIPLESITDASSLERDVAALKTEVNLVAKEHKTQILELEQRISDLTQRLDDAEQTQGRYHEDILSQLRSTSSESERLDRAFDHLRDAVVSGQRATGFGITTQGVLPMQTKHGVFLLELTGYDKTADGYDLHLRLANGTPFRIYRFRLHGEFGRKSPDLSNLSNYSEQMKALDSWESTLGNFEQGLSQVMEPGSWSNLVLPIPAEKLTNLEFIRLWMGVDQLSVPATGNDPQRVIIDATKPELAVFPSSYGTFYLKFAGSKASKDGESRVVTLRFGNPFGMTINRIRLSGHL